MLPNLYRCLAVSLLERVSRREIAAAETSEGTMVQLLKRLSGDQAGVTALEYALIAALVAVVIIGGVSMLGTSVSSVFSTVASTI